MLNSVLDKTTLVEARLAALGADGSGLVSKARSLDVPLDSRLVSDIRELSSQRADALDDVELDMPAFEQLTDSIVQGS
ncbi:hypothetical protein ACS8E9_14670 [Pseudomonas neustonica]|uniref:hypothetical protein n=1 Tax=Pseudomonas neustonica TaxID=2487346 RepID=UPI003F48F6E4